MNGNVALDTSVAVRFLNGDQAVVAQVLALTTVILPTVVVGELLFGAENSSRPLQNLPRYLEFIETCEVVTLGRETAVVYAQTRLALKQKGRPIPMNDVWIAAQCLEHSWRLVTDDSDFSYVDGLILENW
ncbi:type II toxin-antitoxin system VapC family toxin [Nostoc sp. FACHB-87]|uniref:type II toxin-antitoxin system VapC family toxin n=1 Tax=Nostocaceae TaxID=1162 RepID=UPI00168489C3|nr:MULTISPECIES: type II toxin-antitoxin system VapC family toxin [Nostocaceae]MBD2303514.1 type II toxin-antitoxin system VapC family toxin [Nostoc sp. FACHB-190]MBD2453794.1 type II toxin-antitoxin system VapC family toxin [Nostoc sp. FACHB-87]MBD2475250.1 type II toxin-antitoxin system VapC family toxin [Anabaena sp. FACHB-83]